MALTAGLTAVWLFFVVTGRDGGAAFKGYQLDLEAVVRVAVGLSIMTVLWGWRANCLVIAMPPVLGVRDPRTLIRRRRLSPARR